MADISKIQLPDGNSYDIKDKTSGYMKNVTLNGSSASAPSFYAPTTAGTSGYVLKSNGSGAPTWASISTPVTYSISMSGNVITLTGSDSSTSTVTLPIYDGSTT